MTSFTRVTDDVDDNLAAYHNELIDGIQSIPGPRGFFQNGLWSVTVASNNLTVAVKTLAGANPSSTDPVSVRIGNNMRLITSALSVTANAATNWFNSGASELATVEQDYFVYVGYNATDGVVLGFARIPWGTRYDSFSTTSTAETYCKISTITNASAADFYENCGRFAATLSGGAAYTWAVPTFTAVNLRPKPTYETRWLSWNPTYSASGSLTYTSVSTTYAKYKLRFENELVWELRSSGTLGGSASTELYATLPFEAAQSANSNACGFGNTAGVAARVFISAGTPDKVVFSKYDASNFATSGTCVNNGAGFYEA